MVFRCLLAAAAPSLSPLAAAALVCVHWNAAATPRLYNSLHLLAGARLARLVVSLSAAWQHRLAAFQRLPYPGTFVRSIEAGRPRRQLPDPLLSHYTALADPHADALADQARFIQLLTLLSTRPGGSLTHVRSVRLYAGWYRDFVLGQLAERCPDIETLETTAVDAGLARVLASLPRLHRLAVLLMDGDDLPVHLTGAESAAVSMFLPQTALRRESRVLVLRALQQLVIASSLSSLSSSEMDAAAAAGMGMGDAFVPCATNSVILNFRAPLLTRLVLSSVTVHTPDLTALLHRSPSIRHLAFTHIAGTTTPHTDHEDLLSAIAALPCLESLALHAPVRLGPFDLIDHLPPLSDTLTTLDLDSIAFEPLGYETWTARLSLSRLRLAGCAGVCLPADPRFLADLTLVRLDDISQTELRPLLATARSLCRLSLVDMPGITALAVAARLAVSALRRG
ncbi:hypothetical protein BC831DRAFT_504042 [Entophlyctis helioformis]|nr:hypothetical protein BC831DRAFT_504042 [Entophlyctis helioformis]